ncbi:amino acid permease [Streptomyces sp. NPDC004237]|uniref:amino acid permease n=1 Tax=Streptomyces sp. NPDC004237 TaxID=3154455 RepID=UPI0033BAF995
MTGADAVVSAPGRRPKRSVKGAASSDATRISGCPSWPDPRVPTCCCRTHWCSARCRARSRATGIPAAATIMNLVVITAVLSAVNASVFTNSRTFYNLSLQGNAPSFLGTVNRRNVPSKAVTVVFVTMGVGVVLNFLMPDQVFTVFSSVTVYGLVCAWASIMISHLRFRRVRIENGQEDQIRYKMPLYPFSNYVALVFIATVLVCIAILPDMRTSLYVSGGWVLLVFIAYKLHTRGGETLRTRPAEPTPAGNARTE